VDECGTTSLEGLGRLLTNPPGNPPMLRARGPLPLGVPQGGRLHGDGVLVAPSRGTATGPMGTGLVVTLPWAGNVGKPPLGPSPLAEGFLDAFPPPPPGTRWGTSSSSSSSSLRPSLRTRLTTMMGTLRTGGGGEI